MVVIFRLFTINKKTNKVCKLKLSENGTDPCGIENRVIIRLCIRSLINL